MIIKRKLYSAIYTQQQIDAWKKPLTFGQRAAMSTFLGGMGAFLGALALGGLTGSTRMAGYGAALGGTLGTGYGIYATSKKTRDKWVKKEEDKLAEIESIAKSERERIYQELKKVWESQRPMSYEEFYKKFPGVKRDLDRIEFDWSLSYNDINYPNYSNIASIYPKFNPQTQIPIGRSYDEFYDKEYILLYDINRKKYLLITFIDGDAEEKLLSSRELEEVKYRYFSTFKSYNEKFLGVKVEINSGVPTFDVKKVDVTESDFIKAIYSYEKEHSGNNSIIDPLTLENVKKRVSVEHVEWNEVDELYVIFGDKESDFFWSFVVDEYSTPSSLEVDTVGD